MAVEQVRPGGGISLPAEIQEAAGMSAGDLVSIEVTDKRTVEIRRLRPMRFAEALEWYRIEEPIDALANRES